MPRPPIITNFSAGLAPAGVPQAPRQSPGLFNRLSAPGGLLDPNFLLDFGSQVLQQSGPSLQPRGLGQIIGSGVQAGFEGQRVRELQDLQRRRIEASLQPEPQETFEPVIDEQGNVVGQQSSLTGRVVADPRATGPGQATFEAITDAAGNIVGQRNTLTNQVTADPRAGAAEAQAEQRAARGRLTTDLRVEAAGLSREFRTQERAVARLRSVAFNPDGSVKQTPAASLALVFNFMKILDPASVVRESEFATAAEARAWLERQPEGGATLPAFIVQGIQTIEGEGFMTESQIRDFAAQAEALSQSAAETNAAQLSPLLASARAQNIPFDRILTRDQQNSLLNLGAATATAGSNGLGNLSDADLLERLQQ